MDSHDWIGVVSHRYNHYTTNRPIAELFWWPGCVQAREVCVTGEVLSLYNY